MKATVPSIPSDPGRRGSISRHPEKRFRNHSLAIATIMPSRLGILKPGSSFRLVPLAIVLTLSPMAHGLVTITVAESGGGVTVNANGSINLGGLTQQGSTFSYQPSVKPRDSEFTLGGIVPSAPLQDYGDTYRVAGGGNIVHPSFGPGGWTAASSGSGSLFGFVKGGSGNTPPDLIMVPDNYVSGSQITASAYFSGATIASLGMSPGQYIWSWGAGANADSIVMNITEPNTGSTYEGFVSVIQDPENRDPEDDADRDGISNAIEFVIDGDPAGTNDSSLLPTGELETSDQGGGLQDFLKFTFRRSLESLPFSPAVEYSTDLSGNWTPASHGTDGVGIVVTPNLYASSIDRVETFLPVTLGPDGRLFARLRIVIP